MQKGKRVYIRSLSYILQSSYFVAKPFLTRVAQLVVLVFFFIMSFFEEMSSVLVAEMRADKAKLTCAPFV